MKYELFHFSPIVLDQILSQFFLDLVKTSVLSVLEFLSNWNAVLIDHYQYLFRLGHIQTHYLHDLFKDLLVDIL